jgi:hypothetical protein
MIEPDHRAQHQPSHQKTSRRTQFRAIHASACRIPVSSRCTASITRASAGSSTSTRPRARAYSRRPWTM